MNGAARVDIVIDNYNYGEYLPAAIDSALGQDHPVTVVVVDDGSTDGSRDVLRSYGDAIEVVLQDNAGQSAALNAGFVKCAGELVMFLDADDVLTPDMASRAAEAFAAAPLAARVQFRMELIDAAGRRLGETKPPSHRPMPSGDLRRAELAFPLDLTWVAMSGNVYRADALRRIMPIPAAELGRWGSDWYLSHLTSLLGDVISVDQVGAFYRVHGANAIEPSATALNLERIRHEIVYQGVTMRALERLADDLGLDRPRTVTSFSNVALRVISHKLAPARHPERGDRTGSLLASAVRAASRRYDVTPAMRVLLVVWLSAIASAPSPLARRLAELFVFPERRGRLNELLARMHRKSAVVGGQ